MINNKRNYSKVDVGNWDNLGENTYQPSPTFKVVGKKFIRDELGLTGAEISYNLLEANTQIPFTHKHRENEEIYLGIKGQGQIFLDGTITDIREGSCIRVGTDAERAIRNHTSELFVFIVIQVKQNSMEKGKTSDGYVVNKEFDWNI